MSILIKREMSKGCWACPFAIGKHYECLFTNKSYNWGLTKRPSDCPLVEIPTPHGRLIAEKTITEIRYHDADGYHIVNGEQLCELEIDADTVIEAEWSEA